MSRHSSFLSAELNTADDVAEWLSNFGSAAEVVGYTNAAGQDCIQILFGQSTCSLELPLTGTDVLHYYGLLIMGQP